MGWKKPEKFTKLEKVVEAVKKAKDIQDKQLLEKLESLKNVIEARKKIEDLRNERLEKK